MRLVVLETSFTKTISMKGKVMNLLFETVKDIIISENITHLLLQSREKSKKCTKK